MRTPRPKVPFLELRPAYLELKSELDAAYDRVMQSGRYILGEEVEAFEAEFAGYCGAQFCVTTANGLEALRFSLEACGIGSGDEVLVPANTFIATWLAVSHCGARPVPVEPSRFTHNLDVERLEAALTVRTRAIIAVHLYGLPADMLAINDFARKHGLVVIEDAAQAHGARFGGARVGGLSAASAFSFYPTKNLGAFGDAGAVVTGNREIADRVRLLRNYGSAERYVNEIRGHNSRMDPLQAAFLRVRLACLDVWNARRQAIAGIYLAELRGLPSCVLPSVDSRAEAVWHQFVICHSNRDRLRDHLGRNGVGSAIHYPVPPHLSGAYADHEFGQVDLSTTVWLANSVLSLPMNPHLTPLQAAEVCRSIASFPA